MILPPLSAIFSTIISDGFYFMRYILITKPSLTRHNLVLFNIQSVSYQQRKERSHKWEPRFSQNYLNSQRLYSYLSGR